MRVPWRSPHRSRLGFTLIEVIVAIVILAIGVLGVAGFVVTSVQTNRGATNRSRADELLFQKVEEFQSAPYSTIATGQDVVSMEGVQFTRQWTVTPNEPIPGVLVIDLTATWTERGDTFDVETSTMRSAN